MKKLLKNAQIQNTNKWFYILSAVFISLNAIFLLNDIIYFGFIAFLLAIAWFGLFAYNKIYYFIIFLTPLSIPLSAFFQLPFDLSLPSEALMILLTGILTVKLFTGEKTEKKYLLHPVSISIGFYLLWMFYTSLTGTMPLVSIKFFLAKIWFITPIYFFSLILLKNKKNIYCVLWLYIISFFIVIIYTTLHHLNYGLLDKQASHWVMSPFYNDHTSYGAMISMYWPVLLVFLLFEKRGFSWKIPVFILFTGFSIALVLSYSRAAWLSLVLALILGMFIYWKINFKLLLGTGLLILSLIYFNRFEIIDRLEKNRQDSSVEFSEHIRSAANIATDASNVERINRWKCAIKMFEEKPILGWGPGTYMFQYAPFQMSRDKTIISTNFGDWGNAHSEYFSALADSGIIGLMSFLTMIFFILYTGILTYHKLNNKNLKLIIWAVLVGLISYLIHGFLNNFLDTDKANVPFWTFTAIIVSIHISLKRKNPQPGGAEDQ